MAGSKWSLRNIYLYLVCLITLIMVIVGAVGVVRSGVELLYPEPTIMEPLPKDGSGTPEMTEEEWQRQQEIGRQQSQRWAIINVVGNLALVLIAGPIYIYHWRKIEEEKSETTPTTA
ncbi:hypothetical protein MX659_07570 [Coriobacteriia bacterium Es71-Z0120]|uniref:hypothetical protein n=1 Tax=Parvivirga hydrogeniphila TaxID=2939460 RepID=UPI002260BE0F|nr:hypothetical protein [Parvivirga hydrogeniphila]MCL4079440.1 hypothetical protein [Parvivirga hydrogeniphila]